MTEQKFQKKISDQYTKDGWFVLKLVKTNKPGIQNLHQHVGRIHRFLFVVLYVLSLLISLVQPHIVSVCTHPMFFYMCDYLSKSCLIPFVQPNDFIVWDNKLDYSFCFVVIVRFHSVLIFDCLISLWGAVRARGEGQDV